MKNQKNQKQIYLIMKIYLKIIHRIFKIKYKVQNYKNLIAKKIFMILKINKFRMKIYINQ